MESSGVILVYGSGDGAIEAGNLLKDHLDVTALVTRAGTLTPPRVTEFPIVQGAIRAAKGHLGAFEIVVDGFAVPLPSSRGALAFGPPRDGAVSHCDILLDISGGPALFPASDLRDGYLRADPGDPCIRAEGGAARARSGRRFDKPRYVTFTADLCAHSRSRIVGCRRCLDLCPTSAIVPDGDHVAIDAEICAGCGHAPLLARPAPPATRCRPPTRC